MSRHSLAFVALIAAAGCGAKTFGSICGDSDAPATCGQSCDATPGATNTCGTGLYCTEDGTCDAQCSASNACPSGYECTADGRCTDDGSGSGEPAGPDASCPAVNFTPMPTTPSVLLLLDHSGSMTTADISPNRYKAMRTALTGPSGVVTGLQTKAYFGAAKYGCDNNNALIDPVARALNNAGTIDTYLGQGTPNGGTPTDKAINEATQTFTATPPPAGSPPVIVLATDGEPNSCGSDNPTTTQTVQAAANAYAAGIPVYVLAIAENSQHFQDVANAGQGHQAGQPDVTYYPVTNAADLQSAFQTIINGVISCDLTLTSSIDATQASQGTVSINGMNLTYGTDWTLVNGNTIHVEGQACTMLKTANNPTVAAQFPCGAVIF